MFEDIQGAFDSFPIGDGTARSEPNIAERQAIVNESQQSDQPQTSPQITQGVFSRRTLLKAGGGAAVAAVLPLGAKSPESDGQPEIPNVQNPPQLFIDRYNEFEENANATFPLAVLAQEVRRNFTEGLGKLIEEGGLGIKGYLSTREFIGIAMESYLENMYGVLGTGTLRYSDVGDVESLYQMVLKFSALDFACMYGALDYLGSKKNDETYIQYNGAGDKVEKITEEGQNLILSRLLEQDPPVSDFRVMYFALMSGKLDFKNLDAENQAHFFTALQVILNKADSINMVNPEIPESNKVKDIFNSSMINGIIGRISGQVNMDNNSAHLARRGLPSGYWRELVRKTLSTNQPNNRTDVAIRNLIPSESEP